MATKLGPVLQFLGIQQHENETQAWWGLSILGVRDITDRAPRLTVSGGGVVTGHSQCAVPGLPGLIADRIDAAVPLGEAAQDFSYQWNDQRLRFSVPAQGQAPTMAYVSCNGFSDMKLMKRVGDQNALWRHLLALHQGRARVGSAHYGPLNLLLHGGDQIYSDELWSTVASLRDWSHLSEAEKMRAEFTPQMQAEVETAFAQLYLKRWTQPEVAAVLAQVPAIMMWDDHDIIDGWGSYPSALHECAVYQGIFRTARRCYALFQRHMTHEAVMPPASLRHGSNTHHSAYRMGPIGLLVLDTRSERQPRSIQRQGLRGENLQPEQVMSAASWDAIFTWLDTEAARGDMKHLWIMSSIPVVHPSFELLEKLLGIFPGQQELEDDLRDHWTSPAHRAERLRLIHRLLAASARGTRITVLSGDVHVAAVGVIESERSARSSDARTINQLTSSGIVHPPPPAAVLFFLEQVCRHVESVDRGISAQMHEFPTTRHRMVGRRNFLTLQPDAADSGHGGLRYWANWWAEGEPHPYTKVIHSVA